MFGVSVKVFRETVDDIVNIASLHHNNVTLLQEALGHCGTALNDINQLVQMQDARIELLEKRLGVDNGNEDAQHEGVQS